MTVKFFDSDGRLISEGSMRGKLYLGTWNYYQCKDKRLLIQEHYDDNDDTHVSSTLKKNFFSKML